MEDALDSNEEVVYTMADIAHAEIQVQAPDLHRISTSTPVIRSCYSPVFPVSASCCIKSRVANTIPQARS